MGKKRPGVYDKALSKAGRRGILVESKGKIERLLGGASSAVGMCMVYCAAFENVLQTETHTILPHHALSSSQAEFGRLNGHFQVPNPDYEENNLDNPTDETSIEAIRFYKWVNGLHGEYEVFKNGGESKILNNERVVQLIKMGFQFGGVHV